MGRRAIAITGIHGRLGGWWLRRAADSGRWGRLIALDLAPPRWPPPGTAFRRVDLTTAGAAERLREAFGEHPPAVILHAAFLEHPTTSPAYERALAVDGTSRLLGVVGELRAAGWDGHLVVASSTLVYGPAPDNPGALVEEAPLRPGGRNAWLAARAEADRRVARHWDRHGGAVTLLRFAPLLAPGERTFAGRYLSLPVLPVVLGFDPMVQLLHAADALDAIERVARASRREGLHVYNVAPEPISLLGATRLAGRRALPVPGPLLERACDRLFPAGLAVAPGSALDLLRFHCLADGGRARCELGLAPPRPSRESVRAWAAAPRQSWR